jgi:DNA-binding NarL/FixJ family response regulator
MTTIIIGDDHPLVQAALRDALGRRFSGARIIDCYDLDAVLAATAENADDVDLVLLDLNMPGTHGFTGLFLMQTQHPTVPVAILSAIQDPTTIRRALSFGASGYIPKSLGMDAMAEAVGAILNGDVWSPDNLPAGGRTEQDAETARRFASLSAQQLRILTMIVEGRLNKQIAWELQVSEQTVKVHVSTILKKLGVVSRTQAAVAAQKLAVDGEGVY